MSYTIGPWLFTPSSYLISFNNVDRELDPLSFKLISYFILNQGRIISREELVEYVWKQSFVDDNAINRAISELRKLFKHKDFKEQVIKTHYRKGYSLTANIEEIAIAQKDIKENSIQESSLKEAHEINKIEEKENEIDNSNIDNSSRPNRYTNILKSFLFTRNSILLLLAFVIAALLSFYYFENKPTKNHVKTAYKNKKDDLPSISITAATWNMGAEANPLSSPNGEFIAYSNLIDNKIKSIVKSSNNQREVLLKYKDYNIGALSWQPKSNHLIVQLAQDGGLDCQYALFDLSGFPSTKFIKTLKKCDASAEGYAQLSLDGQYLYFTKNVNEFSGSALYQHHLASNNTTLLVPSIKAGRGILHLKVSNNGQSVAYLVSEIDQPLKLYSLDFSTNENKLLLQLKNSQFTYAFDWSKDDNYILVADNNVINKVKVLTKETEKITLPDNISPFYMSVEANNQLLASQIDTYKFEVVKASELFNKDSTRFTTLFNTDANNYYPVTTNGDSKKFYFISDRSGDYQIWQQHNGVLLQLTDIKPEDHGKNNSIGELKLSLDERYLLFSYNNQLNILALENNEVYNISELNTLKIESYIWGKDTKEIIYSSPDNNVNQLWRFDLLTRTINKITNQVGNKLINDRFHNIYFNNDGRLTHLNNTQDISLPIPRSDRINTAISDKYFYSNDGISTFSRLNLSTGEVNKTTVPFKCLKFSVTTHEELLMTTVASKNTHIKRISW